MTFVQAPTAVVLTDQNGLEINTGTGTGPFTGGPTAVVVTDKVGNAVTVGGGALLGSNLVGPAYLVNPTYSKVFVNSASGHNTLYTVPAGKRATLNLLQCFNTTVGAINVFSEISFDNGVTWHRVGGTQAASAGVSSGVSIIGVHAEAGTLIGLNCAATGLNITGTVTTYDTSSYLKSAYLTTFINGDNTLYTCPAGKQAVIYAAVDPSLGAFDVANETGGGAINYVFNIVASGGSPATTNRVFAPAAGIADGVVGGFANASRLAAVLNAGDFLSVNSSSTGKQIAWAGFMELPA